MTVLDLINTIVLVLGIGIMLMAFSTLVIRALGEERRKNGEHSMNMLDKYFTKLGDVVTKTVKDIYEVDKQKKMEQAKAYDNMFKTERE